MQMLDEMASTVGKEFDFQREARLMKVVADRLQPDGLAIRIPRPLMHLTTPNLLVMEQMAGESPPPPPLLHCSSCRVILSSIRHPHAASCCLVRAACMAVW